MAYHDQAGREITRDEFLAAGCPGCREKDARIAAALRQLSIRNQNTSGLSDARIINEVMLILLGEKRGA